MILTAGEFPSGNLFIRELRGMPLMKYLYFYDSYLLNHSSFMRVMVSCVVSTTKLMPSHNQLLPRIGDDR